jgi:glycosyltransferase involved in cell wall biosynthesis
MLEIPIRNLRRKYDFTTRYVCDGPGEKLNSLAWEYVPWSEKNEVADLTSFDIGVMPLADTPENRGKCGFKALQYMAMGIPPVVSPVGFNSELITAERDGFLPDTPESWEGCLERLLRDREKHGELAVNARKRAEDFSIRRIFEIIRDEI